MTDRRRAWARDLDEAHEEEVQEREDPYYYDDEAYAWGCNCPACLRHDNPEHVELFADRLDGLELLDGIVNGWDVT